MSGRFGHLKELTIGSTTREFEFPDIAGVPVLIVESATDSNKPYFRALLKENRKFRAGRGRITPEMADQTRDADRELYPQHVVKGWRNVADDDGAEVEFSAELCTEFLEALPGWLFDELRLFCTGHANFLDVEEDSGNS